MLCINYVTNEITNIILIKENLCLTYVKNMTEMCEKNVSNINICCFRVGE